MLYHHVTKQERFSCFEKRIWVFTLSIYFAKKPYYNVSNIHIYSILEITLSIQPYLFPFKYPLIVDTLNWNLFSDKDGWMVSLVRRLRKMPDRVTSGRFVHCTLYYCMTLRCPACSCSEMLWQFSWIIESDDKENLWSKLDFCLLVFSCFDKTCSGV